MTDAAFAHTECGDPAGFPVLYHHGTPGTAELPGWWPGLAAERGLRFIGFDRPGYTERPATPGRRVADIAGDAASLADRLGLDRFAAYGVSGGGPFALATGALLPGRAVAVAVAGTVAPYGAEGLDLEGMGEANVEEVEAALRGRAPLAAFIGEKAAALMAAEPGELVATMRTLLSPPDAEVLGDPVVGDTLLRTMREGMAHGIDGWVDDALAFVEPWGFELGAIGVPVSIWHGGQDWAAPPGCGRWLAATIPGAELHLDEAEGHLSRCWCHVEPIFDWLAARTPA
jgi:pimeloyl-ACP methyl ester carboxylesterase